MKKKITLALLSLMLILSVSATVIFAQDQSVAARQGGEYTLVLEMYTVDNYTEGVVVKEPNGSQAEVNGGTFLVKTTGTYEIVYTDGTVKYLYSYAKRIPSEFEYSSVLESEYTAGEIVRLPKAIIKNPVKTYTEYDVIVCADGTEVAKITTEIPQNGYPFKIPKAGDYTVSYVYTDVFGTEESDELSFSAVDGKILVIESELPEQISFGESLTLSAYGYYKEKQYVSKITAKTPSGKTEQIAGRKYTPEERGEYEFVYAADIEGETVSQTRKVFVEYTYRSLLGNYIGITDVQSGVQLPDYSQYSGKATLVRASSSGSSFMYSKVINLREFDKSESLIEFEMYSDGAAEASAVQVTLIDVYNEANTLTVYWWANPWSTNMSYMLVRCNGLSLGRDNESGSNLPRGENDFGTNARNTFSGYKNKNSLPFNFQYDYRDKAVYSYVLDINAQYNILDLDNEKEIPQANLWSGFTADLVLMKVEFVTNNNAGMYITKLAGEDMCGDVIVAPKDDNLLCLTSEYEILPDGAVGYSYRLPTVLGSNAAMGEFDVTQKLYCCEEEISSQISDGVFVPKSAGEYKVEFSAQDFFGNVVTKTMEFTVNEKPNEISFDLSDDQSVVITQNYVVPPISATGGSGKIDVTAEVYFDKELLTPDINNRYAIEKFGALELVVTAKDFIGYTYSQTYKIDIEKNYFYADISGVPDAVRAGSTITFPTMKAIDYNTDTVYETALYINGTELEDASYVVPENIASLELRYTVKGFDDGEKDKVFTVKVIPKTIENQHDFLIYENAETAYLDPGLYFKPNGKEFSLKMPYPVPMENLVLGFSVNDFEKDFDSLQIVFTDYYAASERVVLSISDLKEGKALLDINGNQNSTEIEYYQNIYNSAVGMDGLDVSFEGKQYNSFEFVFKNENCRVRNASGRTLAIIDTLENGDNFGGFSSGLVRVEFRLQGISGEASFILSKVGNQLFNYYINDVDYVDKDNNGALLLSEPFDRSDRKIGETLVIPAAKAYDVLQQEAIVFLTVTAPDGKAICSNVSIEKDYEVILDQYGSYSVKYVTTDSVGRSSTTTYRVKVIDEIAPTLQVDGKYEEIVAVGTEITLYGATANDNVDGEIDVEIMILRPDSKLLVVNAGDRYTFAERGLYTVIYRAVDEQYNITRTEYKIEVR